jgi:hypothetical protein
MELLHSSVVPLTPVKVRGRKKRPSFSPEKSILSPKPRTMSNQAPPKPEILEPAFHVPTVALTFAEFSFWNSSTKNYDGTSTEHMDQLLDYLYRKYGVDDIQHCGPFLILRCDKVPSQDMRPFTIGGCLGVWLTRTQPLPYEILMGQIGIGADIELAEQDARDLRPYKLPSSSTLLTL